MAKSTPTDLADLLESLSVNNVGSVDEHALSNLLAVDVPLDAGVQGAAGFFATNLGLNSDNSLVQTATYVLTKAAILETIQLIGVGGGLVKLDLMGFQLARLEKQVEEINKKLDVILSAPLKLAVDYMGKSMIHMENGSIADAIKEMEEVKRQAMKAFRYAEGQGAKTQTLKNAVLAKQLTILSEILVQSFDGTKIVPFTLLDRAKKKTISSLIENEIDSVQTFHDSQNIRRFTLNRSAKVKAKQDILDRLLQSSYPFISEGRGLSCPSAPLELPYNLKLLPHLLPEGEEDGGWVKIGQKQGRSFQVKVWKEGKMVLGSWGRGEKPQSAQVGDDGEVELVFPGISFMIIYLFCLFPFTGNIAGILLDSTLWFPKF